MCLYSTVHHIDKTSQDDLRYVDGTTLVSLGREMGMSLCGRPNSLSLHVKTENSLKIMQGES